MDSTDDGFRDEGPELTGRHVRLTSLASCAG
jgi:hypothetical protein